jgi:hypothetical protein
LDFGLAPPLKDELDIGQNSLMIPLSRGGLKPLFLGQLFKDKRFIEPDDFKDLIAPSHTPKARSHPSVSLGRYLLNIIPKIDFS